MGDNGQLFPIQSNELEPFKLPLSESYKYNWINVYILYQGSFINFPNVDIKKIINGNYKFTKQQLSNISKNNIILYLDYNQIMELKKNNEELYILDEIMLKKVMMKAGLQLSYINKYPLFFGKKEKETETEYMLYFSEGINGKGKYLSFKKYYEKTYTQLVKELVINNNNNNNINNDNNITQNQYNNKWEIIRILIFLYANEKDINYFYSQGAYKLYNYFLVNKSYIDEFKEIYFYKEICSIPFIKGIKTFNDCLKNIKTYESSIEIKNIYNKIILNNFLLLNLNPTKEIIALGENKFEYPSNFIIIPKEILKLLAHFTNCEIYSEYEILFGKSTFCFRWKNNINRIYIYEYNCNEIFNLISIIELIDNYWSNIYKLYLTKMPFDIFLNQKKIKPNVTYQKQNLISDDHCLLGYVYLIKERNNRFINPEIDSKGGRSRSNNKKIIPQKVTKFKPPILTRQVTPKKTILRGANPKYNNISSNNEALSTIIQILILLYGNEKEIQKFYNQGQGSYNVQNYYIINRDWVEKFKEIYQYNKISTILSKKLFLTFNEYLNNLQNLLYSDEIKNNFFNSNVNINNSVLSTYDLMPYEHQIEEYKYITNFMIIHESILNLIKSLKNFEISSQYEINFGVSTLCLRVKEDKFKVLIYNYSNNAFNLLGIIELFNDYWNNIYNRYLSKKTFEQFLLEKKINANIINQKHNLISSDDIHMGYVYLTENIRQNIQPSNLIIDILILLYGNEKEVDILLTQTNYALKNYYLVNKEWLDKFKQIYHYNEIYNILSIKGTQTYKYYIDNLQYLESLNEIKVISDKINTIDNYILSGLNLSPFIKIIKNDEGEFYPPINFQIINESLYNLIINFAGNSNNSKYDITLYKSNLYLQLTKNNKTINTIIFVYEYNNIYVNLLGFIKFIGDYFGGIYQKYFSKMNLRDYLLTKEINLNLINQKQTLMSSNKENLGYIYLIAQIKQNEKDNIFYSIYQKLIDSIKILKPNIGSLPDIMDINKHLQANFIIYLPGFIIKNEKLNYYLDMIEKNLINEFLNLSEYDILPYTELDGAIKYSFVNEEICNYFKIQNINNLPKACLFKFQEDNNIKIYIYYPNQNCLLNVLNYNNNSFNLKKIYPVNQESLIFNTVNKQAKGLENTGEDCYMISILQCLCHIKGLMDYFLNENIYHQEVLTRDAPFSQSFSEVLQNIWSPNGEISYNPQKFKNMIQNKNAKDLLLLILTKIHEELNNPNHNDNKFNLNNITKELYEFRKNYYSQNYSIISKLFYYEKCNTLKCQNCFSKINKYHSFNIIEFPLEQVKIYKEKKYLSVPEIINLEDCFEQSEQLEVFSGLNQIYCNRCFKNTTTFSYNKLYTCPEILTIILNHGKGFKLNIQFSFKEIISINKYVLDKTCNSNYELISIIVLQRINSKLYHYLAFCKSPIDNQWYLYEDSTVIPCLNNIINEIQLKYIPYILFYQKRKQETITKTITFTYDGNKAFHNFSNYNKKLYEVYNEFQNKNLWAPKYANLWLTNGNSYINLDLDKTLHENGIKNGDKILININ